MIIGSGYSFKGNKESQTVTMKTEEDFVKALNERIRKARETATTAKPGPSTTGAGTTMPGKTQTPAGSSPAAAGSPLCRQAARRFLPAVPVRRILRER